MKKLFSVKSCSHFCLCFFLFFLQTLLFCVFVDSCSDEDGTSVSYAIYGTTATGSNGSDSGVSTDKLAIGIVFSFIGGAIVTGLGVFMWFRRAKSVPLGSKADHASNL